MICSPDSVRLLDGAARSLLPWYDFNSPEMLQTLPEAAADSKSIGSAMSERSLAIERVNLYWEISAIQAMCFRFQLRKIGHHPDPVRRRTLSFFNLQSSE